MVLILTALTVCLCALVWTMTRMFFLILLAVVFAVFFHGAAARWQERTGWNYRVCFGLVIASFVVVFGAIGGLVGPSLMHQVEELRGTLPSSFASVKEQIEQMPFGDQFVKALPTMESLSKSGVTQVSGTAKWLGGALDAASGVGFFIALAVFLMLDPRLYRRGALRLVPPRHRERANALFDDIGVQVHEWTRARFAAMLFVAVFNSLALWLAGVPMALALGVISGLCTFVPFVGPILAAVPGLAIALVKGPIVAVIALAIYVAAQGIEGFVVTPLLQQRMAELPPALLILGQFLFGAVGGVSGLVVAGPATLVVMSLVRIAWVEGALGDDGEDGGPARSGGDDADSSPPGTADAA